MSLNPQVCIYSGDFATLREMQKLIDDEDTFLTFLPIEPSEQKAILFSDKEKIVGFIVWMKDQNKQESPEICGGEILQQIFVVKEERRKGFATEMIKYWEETFAKKTYHKFGVEISNHSSPLLPLLEKEGYYRRVKNDEEEVKIPKKIYFVSSS
jgi:hypothetical protein